MSNYKRKEVMDYLTRKPVTAKDYQAAIDINNLRPRAPMPVASIEQPETDYPTEVLPNMVVPPQNVLPKGAEPVMPSAPGIPNPQNRILELATGGRVGFQKAGLAIAKFTTKQIKSPITGEASKLEGDALMKWIQKQNELKNYNDINFYKAIEKYKNEELGGNLFRFWEESGLSRNNIEKSHARRRDFKFTTLGQGVKSEITKNIDTPFDTVKEMTDAIKRGDFDIQDRINSLIKKGVIEKDKFYNPSDLTKILGLNPTKKQIDTITQNFTIQKKGAYQKGILGGEDIPFEKSERKNVFKYKPEDIAKNIKLYGEEKTIFGTGNQASAARRELEMKLDPEFVNYKENFKKRRSELLYEEHPDFVDIAIRRGQEGGLNYDIGHPVPVALIEKHKFLQTPENIKKFNSISDYTIQDERINRGIIVGESSYEGDKKILKKREELKKYGGGFQSKEDAQLIKLENFLKNKEGKKATQEDINFINQWNKDSKKIYEEKFNAVKNFVDDYKETEPYLKGQEYTTFGFKFDLKPGQNIKPENLQLDRSYYNTDKSFGNLASIAPDAKRFNDLTPKQKALFHSNVINQYGDYIGNVAKASNIKGKAPAFNKEDIQDFKDTLIFGTNEKKGLLDYKNLMYGVGVPIAANVGLTASGYGQDVNDELLKLAEKQDIFKSPIEKTTEFVKEKPGTVATGAGAAAVTPTIFSKLKPVLSPIGTFLGNVINPAVVGLEGYRITEDIKKGVPPMESISGFFLMDEPIKRQKILNRMGDDASLLVQQTKGIAPPDGLEKYDLEQIKQFYKKFNLNPDINLIQKYKDSADALQSERDIKAEELKPRFEQTPSYSEMENFATGGRAKFASGSDDPESDLYISPLETPQIEKDGVEGLYFGLKKEPRMIPLDEKGNSITSGGIRELKKVFSSMLSDSKPEIGYGTEKFNISASKGINPFQGDRDIRYQATYAPEGDFGKFMIGKTPQALEAGYSYQKDGLDLGITGLKNQMGDKSIMLRFGYNYNNGGRVNFSGGGGAIKLARLISESLLDLKNNITMISNTARFSGAQKAKLEALTPYRNIPNESRHTSILKSIEKAKENLPREYHSILDDIKKDVDNFDYSTADVRIKALDKEVAPEIRFEGLSQDLFPMEDPLNNAFIIMDPQRNNMRGRYVNRVRIDPETGRGTRETFDTFDSKTKTFLKEEDWKPVGVESLEKGKEGLN